MTRFVLACFVSASFVGVGAAFPPPKAEAKQDDDKLAKEVVEKFLTAVKEGKTDDAIKLIKFPFRTAPDGEQSEEEMRRDLPRESAALAQIPIEVATVATADTLAAWAKKADVDLPAAKNLESLVKHAGKDVRFVVLKVSIAPGQDNHTVLLVRPEKGDAKIVGACR
jgi:hypothetical protein